LEGESGEGEGEAKEGEIKEGEPVEGEGEAEGESENLEDIAENLLGQFDLADTNHDGLLIYEEACTIIPALSQQQFLDG